MISSRPAFWLLTQPSAVGPRATRGNLRLFERVDPLHLGTKIRAHELLCNCRCFHYHNSGQKDRRGNSGNCDDDHRYCRAVRQHGKKSSMLSTTACQLRALRPSA